MEILYLLQQLAQRFSEHQRQTYLVGGSIRDLLLGEPSNDWDIITDGDAHELARAFANKLGGHYVRMHEKASRVVFAGEPAKEALPEILLDISPLQGGTLEQDLYRRDFTINAIAAPLPEVLRSLETGHPPVQLLDPLNGLADIAARRLKAAGGAIFQQDPLRMLRAVRLAMRYHLSMDPATENLIKRDAELLPRVASERIHDELYAILAPSGSAEELRLLDRLGLFTVLFPEFIAARSMLQPSPHYWDVLEHSIESVAALENLARALHSDAISIARSSSDLVAIRALLSEAEQQGIFQLASLNTPAMKLAALLHDIGKPSTISIDEDGNIHFYNHPQVGVPLVQQIMTRLSTCTHDRRLVQLVTAHHMRPGQLGQVGMVTQRATRRYFVDLGPTGIAVSLLSLADHLATLGPGASHLLESTPTHFAGEPSTRRDGHLNSEDIHSWERHLAVVRLLLTRYIRERASLLPPRLVSPEELMRRLQLAPGPLIGKLLEAIAEAQSEGSISSREEAFWFAEEFVHRSS